MTTLECPDGGRCHHFCAEACFRVLYCGPLSVAKYPGDTWPEDVRAQHRAADLRERAAKTVTDCADCAEPLRVTDDGRWLDDTGSDVCPATAGPCPNLCRPHTVEPTCGVCGGEAEVFDRHTPLPNPSTAE